MPLINAHGDVISGGGGTPGKLNGQPYPFASYGRGCWLNDTTILAQGPSGWLTWKPGEAATTPFTLAPATAYAGGAGRVVAYAPALGIFGSWGSLPNAGFAGTACIGPDASFAYISDKGSGYGLTLAAPNGQVIGSTPDAAWDVQVLGNGQAIYRIGGTATHAAIGRAAPRPAAKDAIGLRLTTLNEQDWLSYWSDTCGFVVQLDGASDGYVLGRTPTFAAHATAIVNSQFVLVWSPDEGESSVVRWTLDPNAPRVPIIATSIPQPAPTPAPQPPPTPPPSPPVPQPIPPPSEPPVSDFATSTFSDDQLRAVIDAELRAVNSSDDLNYWFVVIRQHPTPASQNDWGYWKGRIDTGDGVGKGYRGPATPPPSTPAPSAPPVDDPRFAQLQAEIDTIKAQIAALPPPSVPPSAPDLGSYAQKGDKVTVSAKLPFVGNVTAHGTIDK